MTECNKCGACCKVISFKVNMTPELEDYYLARGFGIKDDVVLIYVRCPHLTKDNLCDLHDTDMKPKICRDFHGQTGYYIPDICAFKESVKNG